jgi:hypothetical protein
MKLEEFNSSMVKSKISRRHAKFDAKSKQILSIIQTNLLETLIDYSEKLYCDNNYKDQLLRLHHQNKWTFPKYITIHYEGLPHKRKYIMGVEKYDVKPKDPIEKRCIAFGIGSSKKEGEQNAAKMALVMHGVLKSDQYTQNDIYYPPWDKISNFDSNTMILNLDVTEDKEYDSDSSVQSNLSKKSI